MDKRCMPADGAPKVKATNLSVGQRLRELRERSGASQRDLARRSGMSPASISTIELGKVSPSVETLKRLLDCLGETLADFFSVGAKPMPLTFFRSEDLEEISLGLIHYHQLGGALNRDSLQFVRATANPGSDTRSVTHQAYDAEIGFVLSGRIEVTINEETRVLGPGDGYVIRGHKQIRIRNIFAEDCHYIFVSSTAGMTTGLATRPPRPATKIIDGNKNSMP
jgi:transcriptional regulator with XRE-family HTH domain